ncbi:hypothetical protein MCOR02_007400 [Pyricularia oryzae]|uniref:Uncharacterized protein n=4 Tax=Pyricularia oryzae TaxID=318829 RepID=G4NF94_PYRO7|nr:uncharacterized protein MGG_04181 [Pyricularia oryzae 70-15]ELQ36857.1 hypothetical protein OOU_Y34scaffold00629g6 [Pyricularia oryzae Y34]KAH9432718.1 hypothetical protein MCOR02_007400 [Pyricularia oryzae]EHA47276.1 hypothetical protein MGG_04181 [Pyricularia oryzae 70-15]KAI6255985.1 hypothetical protein MCOR19_007522 [Pyricularia oryzae]KAI6263864.1 hypothetical protein MCOR34_011941 [Pyricularia oryzae]
MPHQTSTNDLKSVLDSRPCEFKIKAGGATWKAVVHSDRAAYDRVKAQRVNSAASVSSGSSSGASSTKST